MGSLCSLLFFFFLIKILGLFKLYLTGKQGVREVDNMQQRLRTSGPETIRIIKKVRHKVKVGHD